MSINTILVPITHAIDPNFLMYTQELANEHQAKLIILYITSPLTLSSCYAYPSMLYSIANLNMDAVSAAHDSLAEQINELLKDSPHETLCLIGPTTDTILKVAENKHVDMIVIPSSDAPQSGKFMLKPKKNKLFKKTSIPIVVYNS